MNRRPLACHASALPTELRPQIVEPAVGRRAAKDSRNLRAFKAPGRPSSRLRGHPNRPRSTKERVSSPAARRAARRERADAGGPYGAPRNASDQRRWIESAAAYQSECRPGGPLNDIPRPGAAADESAAERTTASVGPEGRTERSNKTQATQAFRSRAFGPKASCRWKPTQPGAASSPPATSLYARRRRRLTVSAAKASSPSAPGEGIAPAAGLPTSSVG